MNLLTGRIERQSERWDLSRCSPPAAVAWTAARALWAAKRGSSDAGDAANSMLDTLSLDDDDSFQQPNSNDPLKFFQQVGGRCVWWVLLTARLLYILGVWYGCRQLPSAGKPLGTAVQAPRQPCLVERLREQMWQTRTA